MSNQQFVVAACFLNSGMLQVSSPLVPTTYEWIVMVSGVVHLALFCWILVWLPRQASVAPKLRFIGLLVALFIPIIGPLMTWRVVTSKR